MGGEDLNKTIILALILGVGLFIQIPTISAQEVQQEVATEEAAENPLRVTEQAYTFGNNPAAQTTASGSSAWAIIRMLLVLLLAAAAVYGFVFFIKKKSAGPAFESDPFLKVLASSHLGNNRYAHIVSVGAKAWLLGSSDGGVNLIGEIEDKEIIDAMLLEDSKKSAEAASNRVPDFLSILRKLGVPQVKRTQDADELRRRRERLKGL